MEDIRDIVDTIVRGCSKGGLKIPDVLAAFVARTIVEKDLSKFTLDNPLTPETTHEIILTSIERLLERDNPSLETMKMQVDYDKSFIEEESEAQQFVRGRNKMISSHKMSIIDVEMADANDFESLTTLYRKIFRFLLDYVTPSKGENKVLEREVAAALESVFPRIGLKSFVQLNKEEKSTQLLELARIILGIRLFNKDQGRGGAGISDLDNESFVLCNELYTELNGEVEAFTDACNRYQNAVVNANRLQRQYETNEDKDIKSYSSTVNTPLRKEDIAVNRWSEELANRRQYLNFLSTLQEELYILRQKVVQLHENINSELANIKKLVSDKNSVPKEVIYPRFDSLGTCWLSMMEESQLLHARHNTFKTLSKYRLSFHPTLTESKYVELTAGAPPSDNEDMQISESKDGGSNMNDIISEKVNTTAESKEVLGDHEANSTSESKDTGSFLPDGVKILNIEDSPDFMNLPLELQGYCPWTLVHGRGLLIPGKPALGVVRWENIYMVCDHNMALRDVSKDPKFYFDAVKRKCMERPEYIHLLRMQGAFPAQSIARLLENPEFDPASGGGKSLTADASTETPTHFIEKNIDINYHWNEWELRKRALKVANLRKCATTTQQTDLSHFKRDNTSQVFLSKESTTQTRKDQGSNPPLKTSYIQGLRGKIDEEKKDQVRVITLTTDLMGYSE